MSPKKQSKFTLALLLCLCLNHDTASADDYTDPVTSVVYTYDPAGTTAEVKSGEYVSWESGTEYHAGSPDAQGEIVILSKFVVDGREYKVTRIGECAFCLSQHIRSVALPPTVTSIGSMAFAGCTALSSISMCDQLRRIGDRSFAGCHSLFSICLPEGLEAIGFEAFASCSSLNSIVLPTSLIEIGHMPFLGCDALVSIIVEKGNPKYDSRDYCNAVVETESNKVVVGCKGTVFPPSVAAIGENAFFQCRSIEKVSIPGTVSEIGRGAFSYCSNLKEIVLSEGLKTIRNGAFWYTAPATVTIPSTVTQIEPCAFWTPSLTSVSTLISEPFDVGMICDFDHYKIKLYVPAGTIAKYERAEGWKRFSPIDEDYRLSYMQPSISSSQQTGGIADLQGRRLTTLPRHGLYIRDGRKYVAR